MNHVGFRLIPRRPIRGIPQLLYSLATICLTPLVANATPAFTVVHSFVGPIYNPTSALLRASDGNYYGVAATITGSIYRLSPTGVVSVVHVFHGKDGIYPTGDLIQAVDGAIYGVTTGGGLYGSGTVFRLKLDGTLSTVFSFTTSEGNPTRGLVQGIDGALYGTSSVTRTAYKVTTSGQHTDLGSYAFLCPDGYSVGALALRTDGNFYGITQNGTECIFKMTPTGLFSTVHTLGNADGDHPFGGLIRGMDGKLYGTTSGAIGGAGSVFSVTSDGTFTSLHIMKGADGAYPVAKLLQAGDGALYGTTRLPGLSGYSTIFKLASGGQYSVLHTFDSTEWPTDAGLVDDGAGHILGTAFHSTSPFGGTDHDGVIYRMSTNGSGYGVVKSLRTVSTGYYLGSRLVPGPGGYYYGTTRSGGENVCGTVFKVALDGAISTLHTFTGLDGSAPQSALAVAADGTLYGTCSAGMGISGTIFKIDPAGTFTTVHVFTGSDGADPCGGLVIDATGSIYGTTASGGDKNVGTVYKVDSTGHLTTLRSFTGADGSTPIGGLVSNGAYLYGTASVGGSRQYGVAFRISPQGDYKVIHTFTSGDDGHNPDTPLAVGSDGALYGSAGSLFKLSLDGVVTVLSANGADSQLVLGADGDLYGARTVATYGLNPTTTTVFSVSPTDGVNSLVSYDSDQMLTLSGYMCPLPDGRLMLSTALGGAMGGGVILKLTLSAPPAPTGLSAATFNGGVKVSWKSSPTATSYNIYRSLVPNGEGATTYKHGIVGTSFLDKGLTNGTRYYYKVTAVDEAGESNPSTEIGATPVAPSATFVKFDTTTHGNWKTHYGVAGYNVIGDASANDPHYPVYASVTPAAHYSGLWSASSESQTCLQRSAEESSTRVAGVWYRTSWSMNINITGSHKLALYVLDFPNHGYSETITISDTATGAVLDSRSVSAFNAGVYGVWNVGGNVTVTLTSNVGTWAVLSGIFFD